MQKFANVRNVGVHAHTHLRNLKKKKVVFFFFHEEHVFRHKMHNYWCVSWFRRPKKKKLCENSYELTNFWRHFARLSTRATSARACLLARLYRALKSSQQQTPAVVPRLNVHVAITAGIVTGSDFAHCAPLTSPPPLRLFVSAFQRARVIDRNREISTSFPREHDDLEY